MNRNCEHSMRLAHRVAEWGSLLLLVLSMAAAGPAAPKQNKQAAAPVPDLSGKYHFLGPEDTLGLLQEEGMVKGYIDVLQNSEESDAIFSYPITVGSRQGDRVEFRTGKIHEKYYRFIGTVQRGAGSRRGDPDYLELIGDLEVATSNSVTHTESREKKHVVFKSLGKKEQPDEDR